MRLALADEAPGLPLRRFPWWAFAGFVLLAAGALVVLGLVLPGRWALRPRGADSLAVHWKVLPSALAAAFALPVFAGRLLTRVGGWPALALTVVVALVAGSLLGNLRPVRLGGGQTLLAIATASALVGGGVGLLAARGLEQLLWPRPR